MYLDKLRLSGFKSFADETTLHFAPGVTAIVGPNGCGKSNVVDAVRWVIGEQRPTALRSEKMENVIFNGTTDRRPVGMAEVELTIENNRGVLPTEYHEVSIGRRLFRDGTSEYLLNGSKCRLKDITALFMDTGMGADAYSVIELKMVDEILSDSAEDRRRMFEEAAGITKYKLRRRQALRKLDSTQADLNRVRDLTEEVAKNVRRLARQADKAAAYEEHAARLRVLERALARVEHDRLTERRAMFKQQAERLEETVAAHAGQQREAEHRLETLRERMEGHEQTLEQQRATLQQRREAVHAREAELRLHEERLHTARRDRERLVDEREEAHTRRHELEQLLQHLREEVEEAGPALQAAEEALAQTRDARDRTRTEAETQRQALRTARQQVQDAEGERAERYRALDRLTSRIELLEEERERTLDRLETLDDEAATHDTALDEAAAAADEARSAAAAARTALDEAAAEAEHHQAALDEATETLHRLDRERDAARAQVELLEGLVASYEEFPDAVRFLAEHDGWSADGTLRTVADVLACDDDARLALDAALGPMASCLLVDTPAEARAALDLLRDREQGRARFLLLDRLPDAPPPPDDADALRKAVRVADERYAPLADLLLRGCHLAETLETARDRARAAAPGHRFFAPSGEWAEAPAVIYGGSRQQAPSPVANRVGRRAQLEEARADVARLDAAHAEQSEVVRARRATRDGVDLDARRAAVRTAEEALRAAAQRLDRLRYARETATERRDELAELADRLDQEHDEATARAEDLRTAAAEADERLQDLLGAREDAEETFQTAETAHRRALDRYNEHNVATVEARNRLHNTERDLERTEQRLDDLAERSSLRAAELERLRETIDAHQDEQASLQDGLQQRRGERDEQEATVREAEQALAGTKAAIGEVEQTLRGQRQQREAYLRQENKVAVQLTQVETRLEDLLASIEEDFETTVDALPPVADDFDEDAARDEVSTRRAEVRSLGSVNPLALEEYEEEKERLDFLEEQQDDLAQAEETLMETITEINATASQRFHETFGAIQTSFSDLFVRLFGEGASARLTLEETEDPLDATIEIVAQPRGKKPSVLAQLSSGEKTLTAIALLFAIYLVKPSPFCILDEVDAPLDDANTGRFMQLIRDFSDDTQFILVTHNKLTMELADRMYGVTMQEQGVSQLVGVAFDEAVEMAGA